MEPLRRRNLQSTRLAANKTIVERVSHIICLMNKILSSPPICAGRKEFMVKMPAMDIKNKAPKSSQSTE
jgi:hypothetical protein